jgi:hypothetical protein
LDGLIRPNICGNVARVKKSARNHEPKTRATFPSVWIRPSKHFKFPCLDGLIQTRVSTNQSTRYIHVIL